MSDTKAFPAGWYPSPNTPGNGEYWDGSRWTGTLRNDLSIALDGGVPSSTHTAGVFTRVIRAFIAKWGKATCIGAALVGVWLLIALASTGLSGGLTAAGTASLITALFVVISGRRSWLHLPSRKAGAILLVTAVAALGVGTSLAPRPPESALVSVVDYQAESQSIPTPSGTPTLKKPIAVDKSETTVEALPFSESSVDDPSLAAGTTAITTAGIPGERTIVYTVTYVDGIETKRVVKSDVTTVAPVAQIVSNGTYIAPPAPVVASPAGDCDPNYSGACVPIASDVDCAGGSGNGPAYVQGPVYVTGSDVYQLDRDGDGVACD